MCGHFDEQGDQGKQGVGEQGKPGVGEQGEQGECDHYDENS